MAILKDNDFGQRIYNRFPSRYREDDATVNYALKRYLQAISDGGFKYSIDEWNGIMNIKDPDSCVSGALPALYQELGFDLFNGIPEEYLRNLLPKLSEAWAKKGSLDVVEFVVSVLSGIKTSTEVYEEGGDTHLNVRLEMDFNYGDYFPNPFQFKRILENFTPFYLETNLIYAYIFYETQKVWLAENYFMDEIKEFTSENPFIPYGSGTRYAPQLNNIDYVLNDTLITNVLVTYNVDPDSFVDKVMPVYIESQSMDKDADSYIATKFILALIEELRELRTDDGLYIEKVKHDSIEDDYLDVSEDYMFNKIVHVTPYDDGGNCMDSDDPYKCLMTNVVVSQLNNGYIVIPNVVDRVYHINIGEYSTNYPMQV